MRSVAADERYRAHQKVRDDSNPPSRGRYNKYRRADRRPRAVHTGDQCATARRPRRRRCARLSSWRRVRARQPTRAPIASVHTMLGVHGRNDGIAAAAAASIVGRALPAPASCYGPAASCDRSDRQALAAAHASCRRHALMTCEHAAACCAASWLFVRCFGADVVLSHRLQSTAPVPSAPTVGIGPLGTCRVRVGERYATES